MYSFYSPIICSIRYCRVRRSVLRPLESAWKRGGRVAEDEGLTDILTLKHGP